MKRYYKAEGKWRKARPEQRRSAGQKLWRADGEANRWIDWHDEVLILTRRAFEAMEFIELGSGAYKAPEAAVRELGEVTKALGVMSHPRCREVGTCLNNQREGLTSYISELTRRLSELGRGAAEETVVRTVALAWRDWTGNAA